MMRIKEVSMNSINRLWLALVGTSILLSACGIPSAGGGTNSELISNLPQQTDPKSNPADVQKLVDGNTAFALSLYQHLAASDGNLFFSPFSISSALAMTYGGARGQTETQMQSALHFPYKPDQLNPVFNLLTINLDKLTQNAQDPTKKDFQLNIANAIWGQKGFKFLQEYLDMLAENYGSGLRLADFASDPNGARQAINDWVSQQTQDKIKELIPEGVLNPLTRLVLTNAIYFKAAWMNQFNPNATEPGDFYRPDGTKVSVPMMHDEENIGYLKSDGLTVVDLPYEGGNVSMLVIMPDSGSLQDIEKSLTPDELAALLSKVSSKEVQLSFPKFKIESSFSLTDAFKSLGMVDAFEPGAADFSGMDGARDLFIQAILHKAYVNVDEEGTEAAAATAVVVGLTALPAEPIKVDIDHPFLFVIRDRQSGSILFMGRVVDPSI
jgi:serine protease inhibitor